MAYNFLLKPKKQNKKDENKISIMEIALIL
jgi:hypothetical protein